MSVPDEIQALEKSSPLYKKAREIYDRERSTDEIFAFMEIDGAQEFDFSHQKGSPRAIDRIWGR